uniref:Cystatin domain-containing protein n=1 Tax=Strongyloides venezuelensis TaxID=75913 RepID=A0A0K0G4E6_STRVS
MNCSIVSILIITTLLIVTGEFLHFSKHHKLHEWENKSTKDRKIINFANDAVKLYNKIHHTMLKLNQVAGARRIYEDGFKRYNIKILADSDCNKENYKCTEEIIADITKNNDNPKELNFSVRRWNKFSKIKMNYSIISILIVTTFLIVIEAFPHLNKHHELFSLKNKDPKSKNIVRLAKESVDYYNQKYHTNTRFAGVLVAMKEYTENSKHYVLEISTATNCKGNDIVCLQKIHSDVYKNYKNPNEPSFYVYREGSPEYR